MTSTPKTLRSVIETTLMVASLASLAIVTVTATLLAYYNAKREHVGQLKMIHRTLTDLTTPALAVSDYNEVHRVLGLVSTGHEIVGIITSAGDVLMSDYSRRKRFDTLVHERAGKPLDCSIAVAVSDFGDNLHTHCSEIRLPGADPKTAPLALLVTLDQVEMRLLPSILLPLLVVGILGAMFLLVAFRHSFRRRVVGPFDQLLRNIDTLITSPLDANLPSVSSEAAPEEFLRIERACVALLKSAQHEHDRHKELAKSIALYELARQVVHDIRSPLAALKVEIHSAEGHIPEASRRRLGLVAMRIQEIGDKLLAAYRRENGVGTESPSASSTEDLTPTQLEILPLAILIEELLSEKRAQYSSQIEVELALVLECPAIDTFACIEAGEFRRAISNLIDNAMEATAVGKVQIHLKRLGDRLALDIVDTGTGIAPDVLPQLMRPGGSFAKPKGSGLGLFHAKQQILRWKGTIEIQSQLGQGTQVQIRLPSRRVPEGIAQEIPLGRRYTVALDDDPTIHHLWASKLETEVNAKRPEHLVGLTSPSHLDRWLSEHGTEDTTFLVDLELGANVPNGLEVIRSRGLTEHAILVTGTFLDTNLVEKCAQLGIKLLPKRLVEEIQFTDITQGENHDQHQSSP